MVPDRSLSGDNQIVINYIQTSRSMAGMFFLIKRMVQLFFIKYPDLINGLDIPEG